MLCAINKRRNIMSSLTINFIIGIASSLATALIFFLVRMLWTHNLGPRLENWFYSDARIQGNWKSTADFNGDKLTEKWEIKQAGHKISGEVIILKGADQGKKYMITGNLNNQILTAEYRSLDKASFDKGTLNLMLINNGKTLKGFGTYYYDPEHAIRTTEYNWEKEDST
jgi:hypothetical protein